MQQSLIDDIVIWPFQGKCFGCHTKITDDVFAINYRNGKKSYEVRLLL